MFHLTIFIVTQFSPSSLCFVILLLIFFLIYHYSLPKSRKVFALVPHGFIHWYYSVFICLGKTGIAIMVVKISLVAFFAVNQL